MRILRVMPRQKPTTDATTYVGTHVSTSAYRRFKAKAKALGQSVASRLRLIVEESK